MAGEFKIKGVISGQGKNSLSYISLMRQIKAREAKGISPSEIMYSILGPVHTYPDNYYPILSEESLIG